MLIIFDSNTRLLLLSPSNQNKTKYIVSYIVQRLPYIANLIPSISIHCIALRTREGDASSLSLDITNDRCNSSITLLFLLLQCTPTPITFPIPTPIRQKSHIGVTIHPTDTSQKRHWLPCPDAHLLSYIATVYPCWCVLILRFHEKDQMYEGVPTLPMWMRLSRIVI